MFYKIRFKFKLLYLKFLNWRNGNGFTLPEPDAKTRCQYRYLKAIANGEDIEYFEAYEQDLKRVMDSVPFPCTRKIAAETYCEVLEDYFGKIS